MRQIYYRLHLQSLKKVPRIREYNLRRYMSRHYHYGITRYKQSRKRFYWLTRRIADFCLPNDLKQDLYDHLCDVYYSDGYFIHPDGDTSDFFDAYTPQLDLGRPKERQPGPPPVKTIRLSFTTHD